MMMKKRNISMVITRFLALLSMVLLCPVMISAQSEKAYLAYTYIQVGKLDSARVLVDEAVAEPQASGDAQVHNLRGYIYKELYKACKSCSPEKISSLRLEAVKSFKTSLRLDKTGEFKDNNINGIRYTAAQFNNDAAEYMRTLNPEAALTSYTHYTDCIRSADSTMILKEKELEFYNALASAYYKLYEKDKVTNASFRDKAKDSYGKVLAVDNANFAANFGLGVIMHNQAVMLITQTDYDIDLVAFSDIQDNAVVLFKQALPFMLKAYEVNPKKKEVLLGLSGIYFSLNEPDKSNEFKRLKEELDKEEQK